MTLCVAVINTPIQYFAPLRRESAKTTKVELKVFYCCDWGTSEYVDTGFGAAFKWDVDLRAGMNFLTSGWRAINQQLQCVVLSDSSG